jgi:hypothetical protein
VGLCCEPCTFGGIFVPLLIADSHHEEGLQSVLGIRSIFPKLSSLRLRNEGGGFEVTARGLGAFGLIMIVL